MGMKETLDKLIADAGMPDNEIAVRELLERMEKIDLEVLKAASDQFKELCEAWLSDVTKSEDKAYICIRLAELSIVDTPDFRECLHAAIRKVLPPYLTSGSVIKAIGAKDPATSVHDAAMRLRKLQQLRSTALVYQQNNHSWGKIHGIDNVTGTIAISSLDSGSVSSIPIANAITSVYFFNTTPEMMNLLYPGKTKYSPSAEYRKIFRANCLSEIYEPKIRDIVARLMVPAIMTAETFENWWAQEAVTPAVAINARPFWEARSVLELHTLLKPFAEAGSLAVTEEAAARIQQLFARLRKDMQSKDVAMLAECIGLLADGNTQEIMTPVFQPLLGKAIFWPATITTETPLASLEMWGKLSVKHLAGFVKAASWLYPAEQLALLGTILPSKCITPVFNAVNNDDVVMTTIIAQKSLSCDMILWIYKNRSHLNNRITDMIDMARCISALSTEGLPREWTAAARELRKATFDKADFQKFLVENANSDIPSIFASLQTYRDFQPNERQSVLGKLSRVSQEIRDYLESGAGSKLMGASAKAKEQPLVTSLASHKRLTDELQDLISRQIPENAAAVALARSYGDLRENAEYDAAKEQRRFLHRRRSDLERTLMTIQPTDFKDVEVKEHAVVGSITVLTPAAGGEDVEYFLLGAWDGDPDRRFVSYKTKIGEALLDKKVGDEVEIPGSGKFTLKAVKPLPEDLRKALANEI